MKYILIICDKTEYWIEIDSYSIAVRQLIFEEGCVEMSCKTDCLAEGVIKAEDISGTVEYVTADSFETKWEDSLQKYLCEWQIQKEEFPIGKAVVASIKYFYPQGAILQVGTAQGVCSYKSSMRIGDTVKGKVVSYDDKNLWINVL